MVWISVQSHSGDIQIDVMRDGTLCGINGELDDVIAYDLSMVEFGEEKSELLHFIDQWNDKKLNVLISYIPLSNETMVLLATDIVEHVYPAYSRAYQTTGMDISDVFNQIRVVVNGVISSDILDSSISFIQNFRNKVYWAASSARYVLNALFKVIDMAQALTKKRAPKPGKSESMAEKLLLGYEKNVLKATCIDAQAAFAMDSDYPLGSQEWAFESQKEASWQLRRIVDVLDEIRTGRPWPPLSATE